MKNPNAKFTLIIEAMMLLGITPQEFVAFVIWSYATSPEIQRVWSEADRNLLDLVNARKEETIQ